FRSFLSTSAVSTSSYALALLDALPFSPARLTCWCWVRTASSSGSSRGHSGPDRKLATLVRRAGVASFRSGPLCPLEEPEELAVRDRKSTRLNSSHVKISYASFCLKKKT